MAAAVAVETVMAVVNLETLLKLAFTFLALWESFVRFPPSFVLINRVCKVILCQSGSMLSEVKLSPLNISTSFDNRAYKVEWIQLSEHK